MHILDIIYDIWKISSCNDKYPSWMIISKRINYTDWLDICKVAGKIMTNSWNFIYW